MTATVGIDLASRPKGTAICAIEWTDQPSVIALWRGSLHNGSPTPLDDKQLLSIMRGDHGAIPAEVTKVAIDAPFGWPASFVDALADPSLWPEMTQPGIPDELTLRRTDLWVQEHAHRTPLRVSADRIAFPAMRLASLLNRYRQMRNDPVDLTGTTGPFCETYPDRAIRAFGLWPSHLPERATYKGRGAAEVRRAIVQRLHERAPWLAMSDDDVELCVATDDALDAVMCALVARAVERQHLVHEIPADDLPFARREGWIRLPASEHALEELR